MNFIKSVLVEKPLRDFSECLLVLMHGSLDVYKLYWFRCIQIILMKKGLGEERYL